MQNTRDVEDVKGKYQAITAEQFLATREKSEQYKVIGLSNLPPQQPLQGSICLRHQCGSTLEGPSQETRVCNAPNIIPDLFFTQRSKVHAGSLTKGYNRQGNAISTFGALRAIYCHTRMYEMRSSR